ncbi:MAG: flagellar basal-body MS-ring/collar protein FliF [Acidimicrobiales bacterium]
MAGTSIVAVKDGVGASISRMTMQQRLQLGGAFFATLAVIYFLSTLGGGTQMGFLYGGLDSGTAAEITTELTTIGVPYELGPDGRSIYVPVDQVNATRIALSQAGVSSGPEGWEILDQNGFTTSEFDQRTGYQRALQGELEKTINGMDAVKTSRVSIVMPEADLFSNDEVYSKATVSVNLGSGRLTDSEVQTIIAIVTGSVEGLTPENVAVSDTAGNVYAAPGVTGGVGGVAGGSSMDIATEYQNALEAKVQAMLEGVVGPGNARVTVTAALDFSQSQSETRQRTPVLDANGVQVIESDTTRAEDYIAPNDQLDTGLLGTEDNLVDPVTIAEGNELYYRLREADNAYLYDETVTTRTEAPGTPTSVSVAVVLDQTVLAEAGLDDAASLTNFENLVGAAVGVQAARGDVVAVQALPFDTAAAEAEALALEEAASAQGTESLIGLIRTGATALIALVIVVFSILMLRKGKKDNVIESIDLNGVDLAALPTAEETQAEIEAAKAEIAEREADIFELIENQPDEVADLLRLWLSEREPIA